MMMDMNNEKNQASIVQNRYAGCEDKMVCWKDVGISG